MVSPRDLAVLKLITNWNLVGCWIARSEGLLRGTLERLVDFDRINAGKEIRLSVGKDAAPARNVTPHVVDIKSFDDLPAAFETGIKMGAEGVLMAPESIFRGARAQVAEQRLHLKWRYGVDEVREDQHA